MKRYVRLALSALAMLAVMLFSAAITLRIALHGHEVKVPDFAGMTVAEASEAALKTGVDLNIENRFYSTTVPPGRILSQAPAAGSSVRHGWQVRVTESLGPQQVTIPDVVGQPMREAAINIRKMQLDLGTLAHIEAPGDPDITLAQTPPPNAGVDQPRVNLLLGAAGSASNAFVLPSFVGMSFAGANRAAIGLGLRVAVIGGVAPSPPPAQMVPKVGPGGEPIAFTVQETPPAPSGPVTAQSPGAGFRGSRGDVIRFTLGSASVAPASSTETSAPAAKTPATAAAPTPH